MRPEIRPATDEDILSFYGRPSPYPVRAYVAELDGRLIGIGGSYWDGTREVAFSDFKPEMREHRKSIIEGARLFQREFGSCVALANPDEPNAERFLTRLGFKLYADSTDGKSLVRG